MADTLLTDRELAARLKVTKRAIATWRAHCGGQRQQPAHPLSRLTANAKTTH